MPPQQEDPEGLTGVWEILSEDAVWQPWLPGVQYYGIPGEQLEYTDSRKNHYFVVFDSANSGTQVNLLTRNRRPLRRRLMSPQDMERLEAEVQQEGSPPRSFPSQLSDQLPGLGHPGQMHAN